MESLGVSSVQSLRALSALLSSQRDDDEEEDEGGEGGKVRYCLMPNGGRISQTFLQRM